MENIFKGIFKGKLVILGVGNIMRRDDGFGPALVGRLQGRINALCLDAGSTPENYLGKIIQEKPDTVLIIDALHLGKAPGEYAILNKEQILKNGLSTHDVSPQMLMEYLQCETGAATYILGVQPKDINFGVEMSEFMQGALDKIAALIEEAANA